MGLGIVLIFLGKLSLDNYLIITGEPHYTQVKDDDGNPLITFPTVYTLALSLMVSLLLSVVMSMRYADSGKFMPAGLVATLSTCMSLFYIYKMFTRREHVPHAKKE